MKVDLKTIITRMGYQDILEEFNEVMGSLPPISEHGPWLCGGALRDLLEGVRTETDYDFFFASEQQFQEFVHELSINGGVEEYTTETNVTYRKATKKKTVKIQAIKIAYYPSIDAVLDSFDYTITQFGYDGKDLFSGEFSLWDLGRRRLALHKLTYGVSTLRRLMKYSNKGFKACPGVLADILKRTVEQPSVIDTTIISVD